MAEKETKCSWVAKFLVVASLILGSVPNGLARVTNFDISDASNGGVTFVKHSIHKRDADPQCQAQEKIFLQDPMEGKIDKVVSVS